MKKKKEEIIETILKVIAGIGIIAAVIGIFLLLYKILTRT